MAGQALPFCSVIVPVYEHWSLIPAMLQCLQEQTLSQASFEVLLVDNGSESFTPPAVLADNVRVLRCSKPGAYAARNHAMVHAKGPWLVFTDADCLPEKEWLERLMQHARLQSRHLLLAGAIRMQPSGSVPSAYEMYDLVKGIPQAWYVARGYAVTANLAVPLVLARKLGGFDAKRFSGGDADFVRRAVARGAALRYVEGAVVAHPARDSWSAIVTKARRIKGGQLTAGTPAQRALWLLRTFTPPILAWYRFLFVSRQPWRYRIVATLLQTRLWGVEILEAIKLLFQHGAERR